MRNHKKRDRVSVADHDELHFGDECKDLLAALVETDHDNLTEIVDPFESYVQRVRAKVRNEQELFHSRFVKGYHTLIEELKHEKSNH